MNEVINETTMDEIETTEEINVDNIIPLDYEVDVDGSEDEGNLGAVIFGIAALATAVIGGVAYAKKKKKNDETKEGFIKKMAIKYLTKNGYTVDKDDPEIDETEDDYNGLIPNEK